MGCIALRAFVRCVLISLAALAMEMSFSFGEAFGGHERLQFFMTLSLVFMIGFILADNYPPSSKPVREVLRSSVANAAWVILLSAVWYSVYAALAYGAADRMSESIEQASLVIGTSFVLFGLLFVEEMVRVIQNQTDDYSAPPWWSV